MNSPLMLNGHSEADHRDRIIRALEAENAELTEQLRLARDEADRLRNQSERAVANLRKQLTPLFRALQVIFGEMDAIAPEGETQASAASPIPDKKLAVWEQWKRNLPGKRAEFIQALLDHGEMTGAQLRVATHTAAGSVAGIIHELKKLGLINKDGGKYSLKEL